MYCNPNEIVTVSSEATKAIIVNSITDTALLLQRSLSIRFIELYLGDKKDEALPLIFT
jgi:hypothetical protein